MKKLSFFIVLAIASLYLGAQVPSLSWTKNFASGGYGWKTFVDGSDIVSLGTTPNGWEAVKNNADGETIWTSESAVDFAMTEYRPQVSQLTRIGDLYCVFGQNTQNYGQMYCYDQEGTLEESKSFDLMDRVSSACKYNQTLIVAGDVTAYDVEFVCSNSDWDGVNGISYHTLDKYTFSDCEFYLAESIVETDQVVSQYALPIQTTGIENVRSMEFEIAFDTEQVEVLEIMYPQGLEVSYEVNGGVLSVQASASDVFYSGTGALINVNFGIKLPEVENWITSASIRTIGYEYDFANHTVCLGTHRISGSATATENPVAEVQDITLYPNPTDGLIYLSHPASYTVLDMSGKISLTGDGSSLDLSSFASGLYFVRATSEGRISTKKIILK